ncbi:uncharacterized protein LOC108142872 [Drosophila elegans]|uniref:uncharacterized protein LOC108142872 n=1 Tax=Drosophila elegans TaxID=30023 RepID=UPI0007E6B089|nr:uncharacterized protein LOC108142872 [Drosophila elegans]
MIVQAVLFCLLLTFRGCLLQERQYKPLRCAETNINQTRSSLLATCLEAKECYIIRPVGYCDDKKVCCVKKYDFQIEENELIEPIE